MSSKFSQIRLWTTELAALEHLKNRCCPFSHFTVVVIPGRKSGERLQDHWSSGLKIRHVRVIFMFSILLSLCLSSDLCFE